MGSRSEADARRPGGPAGAAVENHGCLDQFHGGLKLGIREAEQHDCRRLGLQHGMGLIDIDCHHTADADRLSSKGQQLTAVWLSPDD